MFANAHEIGRIVPTTPWDTVFSGIATWLGIKENDLGKVCPNLHNFDSSYLIDPEEMFDVIEVPPPAPSQAPQPYSPMPSNAVEYLPSDTPSLSPSKEKSSMPTETSSIVPTALPSSHPSLTPSELPSQKPSVVPSMQPSEPPSQAPSELPSQMPSEVSSMQPSDYSPICLVNEVFGATYYFVVTGLSYYWRLQLTQGGTLEADFADSTCSNPLVSSVYLILWIKQRMLLFTKKDNRDIVEHSGLRNCQL